ncbi:DUF6600 domain-containing protein [Mesorhizobium sp. WSM3879]|uniref:DUF6600 domain-containing protein n=1 Tax=Mesorhizobium sp. WSM3879 TaxID=2029406 RepID=UPI00117EA04C|nr:DUF6600 domain-containing protein [Mesorhizobium sp. WSM3879]
MKRVLAQNAVRLMLGGVTACLLMVVDIPNPIAPFSLVSQARAATEVSISTFYEDLSSHGDWVSYHGATVFVPVDVPDDWRPYTLGHWVYTEEYGWLWVSDEPFGWATYHYGRWGYADDIGWYWVPGTRWAPAWVTWRRDRGHIIWAPLPPRRDPDLISIEVTFDTTPDYYWVVVPSREFLAADVSVAVIRDRSEFVRIVEAAQPAGDVTIQNNVVVNKVIDVDVIEKETDQNVTAVKVSKTDAPEQSGKLENDTVAVFEGEVKADPKAKPAKLKDIEQVKQVQAGRKSKPTEGARADGAEPEETAKPEQPAAEQQQAEPEQAAKPEKPKGKKQPAAEQEAEPEQAAKPEKPKAKTQPAAEQQQTEPEQATKPEKPKAKKQPAAEQQAEPEQAAKPEKRKAKKQPAAEQQAEPEQTAKPEKRKAKEQPAAEQQQAEPEQAAKPKPRGQKNKACDPQTDANC